MTPKYSINSSYICFFVERPTLNFLLELLVLASLPLSSQDRTKVNIPKSFDDVSADISRNLVIALSGMSLSANRVVDEGKHPTSLIPHEIDALQNLFHSQSELHSRTVHT